VLDGPLLPAALGTSRDLGITIDVTDPETSVARILGINAQHLGKWKANLRQLPKALFTLTDEHAKLIDAIRATPAPSSSAHP